MNVEIFNAHKQGIRERMEMNLIWDKHHKKLDRPSSLTYENKVIEVRFSDEPKAIQGRMTAVAKYIEQGFRVSLNSIEKRQYCSQVMIGTKYTIIIPHLVDYIGDRAVETEMRDLVRKTLTRDIGNFVYSVKCEVMTLFKQGKITWKDVCQAHSEDCSF